MFSSLHNRFKKTQAAVVIENILTDVVQIHLDRIAPAMMANSLITRVWESNPDLFEGRCGKRPHKISVAACALASGVDCFEHLSTNRNALILSLSVILNEINLNGRAYKLSMIDKKLIDFATEILVKETKEAADSPLAKSLM